MSDKDRKSPWIWIGCFVVLSIPLAFLLNRLAVKEPEIVLWSHLRYGDPKHLDETMRRIRITEEALKDTIIPVIDFQSEPFLDCVDRLEKAMNENRAGSGTFRIVLEESAREVNLPIRLHLIDVPAAEGLRYLTALAQLKYRVTNEGDVSICPMSRPEKMEEGWFAPTPSFFSDADPFEEKVDVRQILERAGIDFPEGTVADYYPKKGLIWLRNTRDQLELVDAYIDSVIYCHPELTWRDQVYHYWMVLTDGYPPAPTSRPISPDPFGDASTSSGEPDPFGGMSTSSGAPDSFK